MKNILKYILSFAFCVGVIFATTTTVNAEDNTIVCQEYSLGDELVFFYESYYFAGQDGVNNGLKVRVDFKHIVDSEEPKLCIYVENNYLRWFGLDAIEYEYHNYMWSPDNPQWVEQNSGHVYDFHPAPYGNNQCVTIDFHTNIPIFSCKSDAQEYLNGNLDINSAINYKKSMENNEWVKPFEDIEINDSNMSSPQLANVSHSGFTVVNVPDERYMVDVYLESGVQNPLPYEKSLTSIGDALFVNSFGLVSDTEGAFTGEIDLLSCYGVDNVSALNESVSQFYSTYPSINAFNDSLPMDTLEINKPTWSIWGQPFGKSFVFFSKSTSATGSVSADNCPLAYTNYKVRYFYYDDDSGFHYGPWTNFIYFSDGRVMRGEVFQGNDGNIIESPLESGTQDSSGNVSMNYGSLVDIENPNELFGYLRSLINNINATGNNFMTLFGTVFSFLPSDLLAIIWLGIGCMILIGIIRAFN